jgi:hypothetical protein
MNLPFNQHDILAVRRRHNELTAAVSEVLNDTPARSRSSFKRSLDRIQPKRREIND